MESTFLDYREQGQRDRDYGRALITSVSNRIKAEFAGLENEFASLENKIAKRPATQQLQDQTEEKRPTTPLLRAQIAREDLAFMVLLIEMYGSQVVIPSGYCKHDWIAEQVWFKQEDLTSSIIPTLHYHFDGKPIWVCDRTVGAYSPHPHIIHPPLTSCPTHGLGAGCETMVMTVPLELRHILCIPVADIPTRRRIEHVYRVGTAGPTSR
ncbi:hypothetical protein HYE68_009961 [Fusarium pseudograminearum]|nr:hypothetical protein HYE68_009961 [Fusarium pseudograminearum]